MSIEADPRILDRLQAPHPKIVVATADSDAAHCLWAGRGGASTDAELLIFQPATPTSPATLHYPMSHYGATAPLICPPGGICLLASFSENGQSQLGELSDWWHEQWPDTAPKIVDMRNGTPDGPSAVDAQRSALDRHLFELTHEELRLADERIARLHGELHELRTEYEQARGVLKRIQDYCAPLSPFRAIEFFRPSDVTYQLSDADAKSIRQRLPTSAAGLAAIDLYSPAPSNGTIGEGELMVVLQACDAAAPLAAWRIPYDRLGRGWVRCAFPVASTLRAHQVELAISWRTLAGAPPCLALHPMTTFPELCARADDSRLDGALAMGLWGTLPGTSIRVPTPGWCSTGGASPSSFTVEYGLEMEDIHRIKPTASASFPYMHPLPDITGFRLHPLEDTLATATLARACKADTDRVLATAQIRHTEASIPVEYALCLTDAKARCPYFPPSPEQDGRVVGFSGWHTIPADHQPHLVSLELESPLKDTADLHFATRMQNQAPITHHWADWLEVRIRLRYREFSGVELPVGEAAASEAGRRVSQTALGVSAAGSLQP